MIERLIEMGYDDESLDRLRRFYAEVYEAEFPDPDERESLDNMIEYLRRKAAGWYGANNYHILLALDGERSVGAVFADYLAEPNAGVIEFLTVIPECRRSGLGGRLLKRVEACLDDDGRAHAGRPPDYVVAEMNDPYVTDARTDNLDPFQRALIWHHWGYRIVDFPYIQPALSAQQASIDTLCLIARPSLGVDATSLDARRLLSMVHEYLRWAMRIEQPSVDPTFGRMQAYLSSRERIGLADLAEYIGGEEPPRLEVAPVTDPAAALFVPWLASYRDTFGEKATAVLEEDFVHAVEHADVHPYHLWVWQASEQKGTLAVDGFVTFFSFAEGGFGGYFAFGPALRGRHLLRSAVARIERQMLADFPGARGWIIECDASTDTAPFLAVGFQPTGLAYRQPVPGNDLPLQLLYRAFGRTYGPLDLDRAALVELVRRSYRVVYGLSEDETRTLTQELD